MKKNIKEMTSMFILASLLISLASCGSSSDSGNDTTAANTSDDTTAEVTTALTDEVPKLDFGGREFRTIEQESTENSFYQEEATGEVVSDAIYNRNADMEERFNVKFTPTERKLSYEIRKLLEQSVLAALTTTIWYSVRSSTPPRSRLMAYSATGTAFPIWILTSRGTPNRYRTLRSAITST